MWVNSSLVLPVAPMLGGLAIKVLVPTAIGQALRPFLKKAIAPYQKGFSIFNQLIVLMIVLNAVSSSTAGITRAGTAIVALFAFMVILHTLILTMNNGLARMLRLDRASSAAFTLHTSQKNLAVSYIVWAGHFAGLHPLALIPAIAYHIIQSIMDTLAAHRFRDRMRKASRTTSGGRIHVPTACDPYR